MIHYCDLALFIVVGSNVVKYESFINTTVLSTREVVSFWYVSTSGVEKNQWFFKIKICFLMVFKFSYIKLKIV